MNKQQQSRSAQAAQPPAYNYPELPPQNNQQEQNPTCTPSRAWAYGAPPPPQPIYVAPQQHPLIQGRPATPPKYVVTPQQHPTTNGNRKVIVKMKNDRSRNKYYESYPFILPEFPCKGTCPRCKKYNETLVRRKWSCECIFIMILQCCQLVWLGVIIVCCICSNEGNKTSYHYCPACAKFIGEQDNVPVTSKHQ